MFKNGNGGIRKKRGRKCQQYFFLDYGITVKTRRVNFSAGRDSIYMISLDR